MMLIPMDVFLLTVVILISHIKPSVGTRNCVTLEVRVQHTQKSISTDSDWKKTITKSTGFSSIYDSIARSSGNVAYGGGVLGAPVATWFGFSHQLAWLFSSVTTSAFQMSGCCSNFESSRARPFLPGYLQVFQIVTTKVTINGQFAQVVEEHILSSLPTSTPLSFQQLRKMDQDYIGLHYGVHNSAGTYHDTKCKEGRILRVNSGSCELAGLKTITSKLQCEVEAQSLGLADTTAYNKPSTHRPCGCIYSSINSLQWNSPTGGCSVSTTCGTFAQHDRTFNFDCICTYQDP